MAIVSKGNAAWFTETRDRNPISEIRGRVHGRIIKHREVPKKELEMPDNGRSIGKPIPIVISDRGGTAKSASDIPSIAGGPF